jgi:TonB-linked SusC/RagA family outer membrane protein
MNLLTRSRYLLPAPLILKVMKLTFVLLTAAFLQVSATGKTQVVTYSGKDASLLEVFSSIKKQTGYVFFYDANLIEQAKPVTVSIKKVPLATALEQIFHDQPFAWTLVNKTITISPKPSLHSVSSIVAIINVKGRVVNEKGEPVAGASVIVKGNESKGTFTNAEGNFELNGIGEDDILIISGVNIETFEARVKGQATLPLLRAKLKTVAGENVQLLSTGYQQVPKERATGSFTFIDKEQFNQQTGPTIMSRLESIANGLYYDRSTSSPRFRVRGLSTINSPADPLIVVDNFPFEGDINNINPNDVESITILKDAAAASIWGTKAGNGVIVITTKKSRFNQSLTTEFNINTTFAKKPDLDYLKLASSSDYIDAELFLFSKGNRFADTNNVNHPPFSPVYELLFQKRNGSLAATEADAQINALRQYDVRDEFSKYFYRPAINQQYAVTTRSGSGKHSWLLSGGYDNNISSLDESYKRASIRAQNDFLIGKKIKFTTGVTFVETKTQSGRPAYGNIYANNIGLYPYARFKDDAGNPLPMAKNHRLGFVDTAGAGRLLDWRYYPSENYKHETVNATIQNILLNAGIDYSIIKGLSVNVLYQIEREINHKKSLFGVESYFTRGLINTFTQYNRTTGQVTYKVPIGGILDNSLDELTGRNFRAGLNYSTSWKKNEITAIAGNEVRDRQFTTFANRLFGYNEDPLSSGLVDNINQYPSFPTGALITIPGGSNGYSKSVTRYVSFYGNASFTYDKKYTLSVSGRKDASNLFGVRANDRWTPLWSAGLGYKISDEKFFKINWLSHLHLRFTYGFNGNANPSRFGITTISGGSLSPYTLTPFYSFFSYYNPDIRWEKVGTSNYGIDFRFRGGRLRGSLEYYTKKAVDLFGSVPIDYTGGIGSSIQKNVASIRAYGLDIQLEGVLLDKGVRWVSDINFSFNRDKVLRYNISSARASLFVNKNNIVNAIEGRPVYGMYSYRWAGLDPATGDPMGYFANDISKDYAKITGISNLITDLQYHGPVLPVFFGSWGHTLNWKSLSITARLMYKFGHFFRRPSVEYSNLTTSIFQHSDLALRWQNPGDEILTSVPSMPYPNVSNRDAFYTSSSVLIEKADHVRLQFISLAYALPTARLKSLSVKKMDVYLNFSDLGILWRANKHGIDPEYISNLLPPASVAAGIRLSF